MNSDTPQSKAKPSCSVCGVERVRLWRDKHTEALYCVCCAHQREGLRLVHRETVYEVGKLFPSFARLGASQREELEWCALPLDETLPDGSVVYARSANPDRLGAVALVAKPGEALRVIVCARHPIWVEVSPAAVDALAAGMARFDRERGPRPEKRRKRRRGGTKNPNALREPAADASPPVERWSPADEALRFNALNPVGTPVRYWTGLREGPGVESRTRAAAVVLCDHASVWVEGLVGSINLSHVEVIT